MVRGQCFLVLFLLLPWSASAEVAPKEEEPQIKVRVELRLGEKLHAANAGALTFAPAAEEHEPRAVDIQGRAQLEVELPAGSKWTVSASVPGYWSPRRELEVGPVGSGILHRVFLWPASTIAGQLRIPKARPMPAQLELRLDVPLHRSSIAHTLTEECALDRDGKFSCSLPAARMDLRLLCGGYVPRYWWRLRTSEETLTQLGVVEMRPGASVAGWVEVDGGPLSDRCVAELRPPATSGGDPDKALRVAKTRRQIAVGKDGFFQFDGVDEGVYQLEVTQPGFAPTRVASIEVWPESETRLRDPLVLRRPLDVELRIVPPVDGLGRPWKIQLAPAFDFDQSFDLERGFEGLADTLGRVVIPDQSPGRFMVKVNDSMGNPFHHDLDLFIDGPHNARQEIRLDLVELRGEVSYREEPVAATLWFGGRYGSPRVLVQSNADGRFEAMLPRGGSWKVDIEGARPRLSTHARVEVEPSRRGEAYVELKLPDAELFGRVTDEEGRPVAGARLLLATEVGSMEPIESNSDGGFEFLGVPPGRVQVSARKFSPTQGLATSGSQQLEVGDGQSFGPIGLTLTRTLEFASRIVSERGPVPGAVVSWFCHQPALADGGTGRSGLEGYFSGTLNSRCQVVRVTVRAPGHALLALLMSATEQQEAIIVPTVGGTLLLDIPYNTQEMREGNIALLVYQEGLLIPFSVLHHWALGLGKRFVTPVSQGTQLEIPQMAAAQYRVCLVAREVRKGAADGSDHCALGYLVAGSALSLRLPSL